MNQQEELPEPPVISKPQDRRMIAAMEGATVGGRIVLPSGLVVPGPPADHCWTVRHGQLVCVPVTK